MLVRIVKKTACHLLKIVKLNGTVQNLKSQLVGERDRKYSEDHRVVVGE
jgi:hypothetical protein